MCKKNVVNIHRHLKSVHALSGDVYNKKLEECKLGVVPVDDVKEDRKIACPVRGCASVVKHIQKHLNNHVLQKKITKEDKILYLRRCQEFEFVTSDVSPLKCIASLKVNELDFARQPPTSMETIGAGAFHMEDVEDVEQSHEEDNWFCEEVQPRSVSSPEGDNCTSESSGAESLLDDPDFLPENDFKEIEEDFVQRCLDEYLKWMTSQWGGNKSEKAAKIELRALSQVFNALELTDAIKPLFEEKYFRNNYLQYANKTYKSKGEVKVKNSNSMLTYTTYVGNFVSYIKAEKLYDVIDVCLEDVDAFMVQLGKIRSNYRKEKNRDDRIREEVEGDKIRTYLKSSTVSEYLESKSAADSRRLFGKYEFNPTTNLTRQEYCLMRFYLNFIIEFRVTYRDGVLLNMTLKEFNTGVWTNCDDNDDGQFQVRVAHHKTATTKGVARVCLRKEVYSYLTTFARHVRPYIAQAEVSSYLFAQWKPVDNDPMQSGSTRKKVTKLLRESNVIANNVSVCCNDLRKNMSTQMIEKYGNDSTRVITGAMAHKESTAEKYYRRHNLLKEAHLAQNMMASYWDAPTSNTSLKEKAYHIWDSQDVALLQEHFAPEDRRLTRQQIITEYDIIKK